MKTIYLIFVSLAVLFILPGLAFAGPEIESPVFNVQSFGAVGDGLQLDTEAINLAISAASKAGGGTVWFPAGTYLSFSIHLQSNISLYIDQGAILLAADPSEQAGGYDAPEPSMG